MGRRRRRRSANWRAIIILALLITSYAYFRANYEGVRLIPKQKSERIGQIRSSDSKRDSLFKQRKRPELPDIKGIKERAGKRFPFLTPERLPKDKKSREDKDKRSGKKESLYPAGRGAAIAAIVIDDFGYSDGRPFLEMDAPLTFAVLPGLSHSRTIALQAAQQGRDVLLHLPMEPKNGLLASEENTIKTSMTGREIEIRIKEALADVPGAIGVNNHMGSKATADADTMAAVMRALSKRKFFFLDSLTTPDSVAASAAAGAGVAYLQRNIFLDGSDDNAYITKQLRKVIDLARDRGRAIAIGHDRPNTANALENALSDFAAAGVRIVPLSALL